MQKHTLKSHTYPRYHLYLDTHGPLPQHPPYKGIGLVEVGEMINLHGEIRSANHSTGKWVVEVKELENVNKLAKSIKKLFCDFQRAAHIEYGEVRFVADIHVKVLKGGESAWNWWVKRNLILHRGKTEHMDNEVMRFSFPSWETCVSFAGLGKTHHAFCCKEGSFGDTITEKLIAPTRESVGKPVKE